MSKTPDSGVVIPFRRAHGDLPPSNDQGRCTVTLAFPNGRHVHYSIEGIEQGCSGSDPTDGGPADWSGPEVRDLLLLSYAQTFLNTLICEAAEATE